MRKRAYIYMSISVLLCAFSLISFFSFKKVNAISNFTDVRPYYKYYDEENHINYDVTVNRYQTNSSNDLYLENMPTWSLSGNLKILLGLSYRIDGNYINFMCPFSSNNEYINNIQFQINSNYFDSNNVSIQLFEVPNTLNSYNFSQILQYAYGNNITYHIDDNYWSTSINIQLDPNYYYSNGYKYLLYVAIPVYDPAYDETCAFFNTSYIDIGENINQAYIEGIEQGIEEGENNILDNPNNYNLYTQNQMNAEYQRGLTDSSENALKYRNVLSIGFDSARNFLETEIFPGISIGLILGLPLLLGLFLLIMKLIRG